MTVERKRLMSGSRVIGYDAYGGYETEPTYSEYVLASDYDALAAENAELREQLRKIHAQAEDATEYVLSMICRDLKLENEALRNRCNPSRTVLIGERTHYVSEAVSDEIESLRARLAEAEALLKEAVDAWRGDGPPLELERVDRFLARAADSADVMHDNNTNVIVQANLASTLTRHPSLSPTHCCVDCGALWRQCDDFSMNLRSASCCDACNNAPVGPQIRPLYVAPTTADEAAAPRSAVGCTQASAAAAREGK